MVSRTNRVIVVGAGLSGLSAALHLTAAGREVLVLDQQSGPGGRHTCMELDGYRFDTGPVTFFTPESLAGPLHAVGETVRDWIELLPVDPVCRAHYPDGTTLDAHADPLKTAAAIGQLCGWPEARAFLRYMRAHLVPPGIVLNDPRTLRLFGLTSLFGFSPADCRWYPRGGNQAVARGLGAAAEKHGVSFQFGVRAEHWETKAGRITAVHTSDGERLKADAFVFPVKTPNVPWRSSHLVIHLGTGATFSKIAHSNVHFGKLWQRSRHEVLTRGEMMTDPSITVLAPSQTDRTAAPRGKAVYQIVVPVPNLRTAPIDWNVPATRSYAGEIIATLEARGYLDLGAGAGLSYVVTPSDWARQGMAYGIPHISRNSTAKLHRTLANAVVAGPGLIAGARAADRVVRI
ncbi:phytoene desaturase family protein [Catelliglobosispora koreensis]|uniref:phytoene desaturase family protein n=1 Tax=Catelliglobosispora koreensis TaxID=129052 RepID=UPI0012FA36AC|nr:FAD-dependent oxidoreductase [Catelliglobosispora koreensis]